VRTEILLKVTLLSTSAKFLKIGNISEKCFW